MTITRVHRPRLGCPRCTQQGIDLVRRGAAMWGSHANCPKDPNGSHVFYMGTFALDPNYRA